MNNIANIQKLHYCNKKLGDNCRCSNVATRQVKLKHKPDKDKPTTKITLENRCEEHAFTPTASKVVVESNMLDQSYSLTMINRYLRSLVGKNIKSSAHTAKQLRVKYTKPEIAAVMCLQEFTNKYKLVYYEQITEVLQ